jgi:hypothetical protein
MSKSLDMFSGQLKQQEQQLVANAGESVRALAIQAYHDLQAEAKATGTGSPVASGRLASSMRLSIGRIDSGTAAADPNYKYPPGKGRRPLPARTIANGPISSVSLALRAFRLGQIIYITNSVPYIRRIEVGGHSWQTPGGVFGPTMRKVMTQFRNLNLRRLGG